MKYILYFYKSQFKSLLRNIFLCWFWIRYFCNKSSSINLPIYIGKFKQMKLTFFINHTYTYACHQHISVVGNRSTQNFGTHFQLLLKLNTSQIIIQIMAKMVGGQVNMKCDEELPSASLLRWIWLVRLCFVRSVLIA